MTNAVAAKIEAVTAAVLRDGRNFQPQTSIVVFHAVPDSEGDFMVCEASNSYSAARLPIGHRYTFSTIAEANEQVRRLAAWQAKGHRITLRTIWTPDRFEAVADTKYGCAW